MMSNKRKKKTPLWRILLLVVILAEFALLAVLVVHLIGGGASSGGTTIDNPFIPWQTEGTGDGTEDPDTTETEQPVISSSLDLKIKDMGNNVFKLSWNNTGSSQYWVQISTGDSSVWEILRETSYTTSHLTPFQNYTFQVTAVDNQLTEHCTATTTAQAVYSTIWPVVNLKVYADSDGSKSIGTADAGTPFCVVGEENGMFAVRFQDQTGYIDSDYCMINLPEYMGDLCSYDIVNSYNAIYNIHNFDIDQITDTIIEGYENVRLSNGQFLVPYLYPAAQKLVVAAQSAEEMGYRLRIYDSFRPHEATTSIYGLAKDMINNLVPGTEMTYESLMIGSGTYRLSNFLAPTISKHNLGVAVDLTLETLDGKELTMQTVMHDLSWYSSLAQNNINAYLLQQIMISADFGTLDSEWWHFVDEDALYSLNLSPLEEGVSPECWMKDDMGWRYRQADGNYITNSTETIDGVTYLFDSLGYATEQ